MASSSSSFSYAQAAKGEAMSRHASQEGSTPQRTETPQPVKSDAPEEKKKVVGLGLDISKKSHAQEASTVQQSPVGEDPPEQSDANPTSMSSRVEPAGASTPSESSNTVSKPISGGVGSVTPADSDSNWERVSQDSQLEHTVSKASSDAGVAKSSSEKSRSQMKEAPLPAVNIWQKRMEDAQAKTVTKTVAAPRKSERPAALSNGVAQNGGLSGKSATFADRPNPGQAPARQRTARTVSNNTSNSVPPPSSDATSWPTPNLAKVDDKKKEQENEADKPATKPHGKDKWEKIAFVPTAVFNTPLPIRGGARGGRGGRGGRESMSRGGSISANLGATGERPAPSDANSESAAPVSQTTDRPKFKESNIVRGGPAYKPKRSASTGPPSSQERGQNVDGPAEKREGFANRNFVNQRGMDNRRTSTSTQTDSGSFAGYERRQQWSGTANGDSAARSERHYHSRLNTAGNESAFWGPSRERGEGRPERGGRGNWRNGKPSGHSFGGSGPGSQYQQNHGFANGKPYTEQRHNSHPAPFSNGRESRHSRANSRSQSIPNAQVPGRYAMQTAGNNGLPSLQTDMATYFPFASQPSTVMSAAPYSYMEQVQLPAMLQMQLEYYLSVENLCKDIFLRKNMDGQGFVFLHILTNFNRVQSLTTDVNLIKWVCTRSQLIEIFTGPDGLDRVRRAEDWQQWVMPMGDRDPSAQNDGPAQLFPPRLDGLANGFDVASPSFPQSHPMSPANPGMMNGFQGEPIAFESFDPRSQFMGPTVQTPLTANVPDFKPVMANHTPNGHSPRPTEPEEQVSDSDLRSVRVVVNGHVPQPDSTGHVNSTALGNGVNGDNTNKENVRPQDNDGTATANSSGQPSHSVQQLQNGHSHDAATSKAQRITWIGPGVDSAKGEAYESLRARALEQRHGVVGDSCPEALAGLFEFWGHFLVDNFNTKAYQEFHSTALEEANAKQSLVGLNHLSSFYYACLVSDRVVSDRLVDDFVGLANVEFNNLHVSQQRPALHNLARFWCADVSTSANHTNVGRKLSQPLKSALEAGDFLLS